MAIHLSPEQESRVADALRSGIYHTPDEVIDRALEILHEHDESRRVLASRALTEERPDFAQEMQEMAADPQIRAECEAIERDFNRGEED